MRRDRGRRGGSTSAMGESPGGLWRRVAVVCVVAVALITAAVGTTIWRYETALSDAAVWADAYHDTALTNALSTVFWREREAMNEYLVNPTATAANEVRVQ